MIHQLAELFLEFDRQSDLRVTDLRLVGPITVFQEAPSLFLLYRLQCQHGLVLFSVLLEQTFAEVDR